MSKVSCAPSTGTDYYDKLIRLLNTHYRRDGFRLQEQRDPGGLSSLMQRYFAGELAVINDIPVMTAGSEFQRTVWQQLRRIPCGKPSPMANWPNASADRPPHGPSAWRTAPTPSALWCPATG
ncbi:Methylated-DNA--protein-cysteine methyltransferase [Serratia rubidaea]|uniref:Methylated-DNA--protein-cysteine methyltransferase n=1 Tax=Serratia rubidaea TaxID=61652 RepID=A0A4U9HK78_SERRU|nr:Methylated-DNA--protein-cysteine methyltransferase [Serratia rubidaea]